jgi:nitroimidazol reductase NimA-like FMN-containing flavoprotein (pyridoxamine 5'-phosphate oxidase superfamily)
MPFFESDARSAADSITLAQHIAFAPIVFQASRALRVLGILETIDASGGATQSGIVGKLSLPVYGVRVLLEAGLGIGLLTCKDGVYRLTTAGWYILKDEMTIANMDFSHDVCYEGMFSLDRSIRSGRPEGLHVFGEWTTIYQGLSQLAPHVQKSWFAFDHFYSDDAYPLVIPMIARYSPRSVLDIGGNTGKFAMQLLRSDPDVRVGIVDLPHVATFALEAIVQNGFAGRVSFHPADMLDPSYALPRDFGAIWMSQFLDCFSETEIVAILTKVRNALADDAVAFILEPFWDRQRREVSAFAMQMTSLYFTGIANGNSQLYPSDLFLGLIGKAGLAVTEQVDNIGVCQSLLVCRKA